MSKPSKFRPSKPSKSSPSTYSTTTQQIDGKLEIEGANDKKTEFERLWTLAHDEAVAAGKPTYIDPQTGYQVFTSETLKKKLKCCGNLCRHCPYEHVNVGKKRPFLESTLF